MAKKIRIAMFRVDNHLYHFAPVLTKLDMRRWRELSPECHDWFTDCYRPFEVVPKVATGIEVAAIGDYDPAKAAEGATIFPNQPRICEDPKDLSRDVDAAFICNCDLDGSDHLKLAEPFIRKRLPTFIDKPFALHTRDAIAMVKLAKRYRTPIYSSSLLTLADGAENVRKQFKQIGEVTAGMVNAPPGWQTESGQEGLIHGVALAQAVFGYGVESVQSIGDFAGHHTAITYNTGLKIGMYLGVRTAMFTAEAFGSNRDPNKRRLHTGDIGNVDFAVGASRVARRFKRMVQTGKPPRDYDEMIENIAVCDAIHKSWKLGRKVKISEVWKR